MAEQAKAENHCPCGCEAADLDEHGYCRHLVGFSSNGKTFEAQIRGARGLRQVDATMFDPKTGRYTRKVHRLQKGDKLVNPVTQQLVDQVWQEAKKWVNDRVYRADVPDEERSSVQDEQLAEAIVE